MSSYIIGVDEVGRGCLAGDVYVAAFMAPISMDPIPGITDSKAISAAKRRAADIVLRATPDVFFQVASRPVAFIDRYGINPAILECFQESARGLIQLGYPVEAVHIDGKMPSRWQDFDDIPTRFIIHGDALDWRIGAASIIAKVARDAYMAGMAPEYPGYGWERNAGYGTKEHMDAIRKLGMTALHRIKFCRNIAPRPFQKPDKGLPDNIFDLFN